MCAALLLLLPLGGSPASALEVITVPTDQVRVEITDLAERHMGTGDRLFINLPPDRRYQSMRMEVRARRPEANPAWVVFALRNTTEGSIERWLSMDGGGFVRVVPSEGFTPDRRRGQQSTSFLLTLDPGQTITYVAEVPSNTPQRCSCPSSLEPVEPAWREAHCGHGSSPCGESPCAR